MLLSLNQNINNFILSKNKALKIDKYYSKIRILCIKSKIK